MRNKFTPTKRMRIQNWYVIRAVTTLMPDIVLTPNRENIGSKREV